MTRRCFSRWALAAAALAAAGCRSAYGVDPVVDPAAASKTPGHWIVELGGGAIDGGERERYRADFDGKTARITATVASRTRGSRAWRTEISPSAYSQFVAWALSQAPFEWSDRTARGPAPVLRVTFRAGDRGRSIRIEGPDFTELGLVDRLRSLAAGPPAAAAPSRAAAAR